MAVTLFGGSNRIFWLLMVFTCIRFNDTYSTAEPKRFDGYRVISVDIKDDQDAEAISTLQRPPFNGKVDFWTDVVVGSPVDIMISPEVIKQVYDLLESAELESSVSIPDVQSLIDREQIEQRSAALKKAKGQRPIVDWQSYNTLDEIEAWLKEQAASNRGLVKLRSIGKSLEGRDMTIVEISKKRRAGDEKRGRRRPKAWLDAGLHAREWISPATGLYVINQLLNNKNNSDLLDAYDWSILPVHNPDGYAYTHTTNRLWRKNRRLIAGGDCDGVDLNRNYGVGWGDLEGSSNDSCETTYHGSGPFSEPETRAVKKYMERHLNKGLKLSISLHSYSQLWMTPWAQKNETIKDEEEISRVGQIGADALEAVHGTNFEVGPVAKILYTSSGVSMDWIHVRFNLTYSYTLELRPKRKTDNGFVLSADQIQPSGEETWEGLAALARAVRRLI